MTELPIVFISHGSPLHALDPGAAGAAWQALAQALPRPRAILICSAHWETADPAVTATPRPQTIHDFYGFPDALYRLRYDAPGDPALAARVVDLLRSSQLPAEADAARGLDHGAWSPLLHMYPAADVPVVQLSVQTARGPDHHLQVGRALRPLAGEGVLIIGSGHMTHNLRDRRPGGALAYAREFQAWVDARIQAGDLAALRDYRALAPHAVRAHPTDEHFLPLYVALGAAAQGARAQRLYEDIETGALAMDCYRFDAPARARAA